MHKLYHILLIAFLAAVPATLWGAEGTQAQTQPETKTVKGVVRNGNTKAPIANVQVTSAYSLSTGITEADGSFTIQMTDPKAKIQAKKDGYYPVELNLYGRDSLVIYLTPTDQSFATEYYTDILGTHSMARRTSAATSVIRSSLSEAATLTGDALGGKIPGLQVINKSGMPGEGSYLNFRGIRSFYAKNSPLVVIDGVPYLPNTRMSNAVTGFSPDMLGAVNLSEVASITLLSGADALPYGSMAANGVLMVETERGIDNKTILEVRTTQGVGLFSNHLPVLDDVSFSKYISDIGSTRFTNQSALLKQFPFLSDEMSPEQKVRYGYNTNWQDEIYRPAFTTDNMIKVRGGDNIAKFMFIAGYQRSGATIEAANRDKFYTRGNADIRFSERLTATASVAFGYTELNLQEQGMVPQSNPLLAAYGAAPLLGTYEIEEGTGKVMSELGRVDPSIVVSNPAAIGKEILGNDKLFDVLINAGVQYKINYALRAQANFGINYNYIKDRIFIGGKTSQTIAPQMGGLAENTVRDGAFENKNYYGSLQLVYDKMLGMDHHLTAAAGGQIMSTRLVSSHGSGINTNNDNYQNLGNVSNAMGREAGGFIDIWNQMSAWARAGYSFQDRWFVELTGLADAASTYGDYTHRLFFYPAAKVGWNLNNGPALRDHFSLSNFMLRAQWSRNPNSRYSSSLGRYYYELVLLRDVSGLIRGGIPNRNIGPENVEQWNVGVDFATRGDVLTLSLDAYQEHTRDMIVKDRAAGLYGEETIYHNKGEMQTRGLDASFSLQLLHNKVQWRVGGTFSYMKAKVLSLGKAEVQEVPISEAPGVSLLHRVGDVPFAFYGHQADGVYASAQEARKEGLRTTSGLAFAGGDVRFKDWDGNKIINDKDKAILGSALPDFYGGFYSYLAWKGLSLTMNFTYSYGNEMYNAVRRRNESGSEFINQAASMARRWVSEGQQTDIPRVTFGDPAGNNRFSSRWIEDASYLKVKEVTLAYDFQKKVFFFTDVRAYLTGENLYTFTKYTGSDPELAYSYDPYMQGMDLAKLPLPRIVKIGLLLNF